MKEATRLRVEAERKAKLEAHIKRVVDDFPPLSPEQRSRLALLLQPQPQQKSEAQPARLVSNLDPSGADALAELMGDK